ncbi:hypothetical protein KBZ21_49315, partial [Streptomyces sp. A73]|nr:hypothetical protein [Streptomyces sp. A73]MBQ1166011.1 hypothetical protein [Streptomyces sp. A73]
CGRQVGPGATCTPSTTTTTPAPSTKTTATPTPAACGPAPTTTEETIVTGCYVAVCSVCGVLYDEDDEMMHLPT